MCTSTLIKSRLLKPRLIANIKEVQQRLYASIKMGIFDKSNYTVDTGIMHLLTMECLHQTANAHVHCLRDRKRH